MTPRALASRLERRRTLPRGTAERFTGYGAIGVPFDSGHLLAFRRYASSSIGPPFTSVWHRDPQGRWRFFVNVAPDRACPRYFGPALHEVISDTIELEWSSGHRLAVHVEKAGLHWTLRLAPSPLQLAMGALSALVPETLWGTPPVAHAVGYLAGALLGVGSLQIRGRTPSAHEYVIHPTNVWHVAASTAVQNGNDFGSAAVAPTQASLGEFLLPRRGLFTAGTASFRAPAGLLRR